MSRLNRRDREFYVRRIMEFKFKETRAKLKEKERELFELAIDSIQGEHKELIAKLPPDYFHTTDAFQVRAPGSSKSVTFCGEHPRPVPSDHRLNRWGSVGDKLFPAKLHTKLTDFAAQVIAHEKEEESLKTKLTAMLEGVYTVKRLYEAWPELEEIVPRPPESVAARGKALTVDVAELNRLIPLPSKKPAAAKKAATKKGAK